MSVLPLDTAKRRWKTWVAYAALIVALVLILYYYREIYDRLRELLLLFASRKRLNHFIASFGSLAPLAFIGVQVLQVLFAPIPGEFTGFIGGYLFGICPGLVFSTVGLTIGSLAAFAISRRLGMPFVRRYVGKDILARFDYLMEHQGAFISFIFFLIPGLPKDYFCYLLGLSPMHALTFFIVSSVGRIPGTLLLTMQGNSIRSEDYRGFFVALGLALLLIVLTIIYRDRIECWLRPKKCKEDLPLKSEK